jgi:serine/threonine protein kinase
MMEGIASVGDVLAGKYRVDKILGLGGMGMVVAATHLEIDQQVALKFMLPAATRSPEANARFMREARAVGKLTSEHICRVIDVGRFESDAPYIVMEYLEGYDLGTLLKKRGPLRVAPAVDYILQACEGLAEAHAQGIVHRDLKPDNLYLAARADGGHIIKVLDFGISKATVTGIATRTGDILGSPAYMSPEQMRSTKDVDARADVWSLGVVMYQLLTGRLPFGGDSLPTLCLSVLNDDPVPPNEIRQDLPEGLSEVILHCLAKESQDRFSDVGELAAALGPFATRGGFGSVTRVRSALKGRQAPPDPSQTLPHGFGAHDAEDQDADDAETQIAAPQRPVVPPPMLGAENMLGAGSDLFAPRVSRATPVPGAPPVSRATPVPSAPWTPLSVAQQPVGVTTLTSSSGESIEMAPRRSRVRFGLVAALCGAIGFVVALIVMMQRGSGGGAGADVPPPQQAAAPTQETPPAPQRPHVTPIEEPAAPAQAAAAPTEPAAKAEPAASDPATEPMIVQQGEPKAEAKAPGAKPERGAPAKGTRGKRPTKVPAKGGKGATGAGSGAEPPDDGDDDQWGRMHHDEPKETSP